MIPGALRSNGISTKSPLIGPCPSIGLPMALTTRPTMPSPVRIEAIRFVLGENIGYDSNNLTKGRTVSSIRITLTDKNLILDEYSILKKLDKSGEVKTYIKDELPDNNIDCLLLDYDSHCFMNKEKLNEFIHYLKEQAKTKQIIIVSQSKEVLAAADCVFKMQRVDSGKCVMVNVCEKESA